MDYSIRAKQIVSELTPEEKVLLLAGKSFWMTQGLDRFDITAEMVTDGPHGLRKQSAGSDHLGINQSEPATCFPTASAMACSFDVNLVKEVASAIADECRTENVAVLLGPGVNIKRSPLCGRNFEYYSEDPYAAGELATAFVKGVQEKNVGVCVKHFALNNQESNRFTVESIADERAIREIYLPAFEKAVKYAKPWSIMSSYNKIWGEYASDSKRLLTEILRDEWGFDGLVISDWGGMNDRVASVKAGLDLQMPGEDLYSAKEVLDALNSGELSRDELDKCVARVVELLIKAKDRKEFKYSKFSHHNLARKAAAESIVLLKNKNNLLPAKIKQSACVAGEMAKKPRYQGAGSSKIVPTKLENACDEFLVAGFDFTYAQGYELDNDKPNEALIEEACKAARGKDIVYVFAGLPDRYESEGFDRKNIGLPECQIELIERLSRINDNIVVILSAGGVVDMSWEESASAILMCHLAGQAAAGAAADVILGKVNPSAKLSETWPLKLEDNPSYKYFPGNETDSLYKESIFVGYRYYDSANKEVRYPFGYGLSYSEFEYSEPVLSADTIQAGEEVSVRIRVKNKSNSDGAEIVQLYISCENPTIFRAAHELKRFEKVFLKAGEEKEVTFTLNKRAFSFYDVISEKWQVSPGNYEIQLASSSRDIRQTLKVKIASEEITGQWTQKEADAQEIADGQRPLPQQREIFSCYYDLSEGINVTDEEFEKLLGRELPKREDDIKVHTLNSTLKQIRNKPLGKFMSNIIRKQAVKLLGDDEGMKNMVLSSLDELPLRFLSMQGGKLTRGTAMGIAEIVNGHIINGIKAMKKPEL